jgi:hypothetical protein
LGHRHHGLRGVGQAGRLLPVLAVVVTAGRRLGMTKTLLRPFRIELGSHRGRRRRASWAGDLGLRCVRPRGRPGGSAAGTCPCQDCRSEEADQPEGGSARRLHPLKMGRRALKRQCRDETSGEPALPWRWTRPFRRGMGSCRCAFRTWAEAWLCDARCLVLQPVCSKGRICSPSATTIRPAMRLS